MQPDQSSILELRRGCDFRRLDNLVLLCDHHHHVLHKPGWHATLDGTTLTITNPDRREIGSTVRPRPLSRGVVVLSSRCDRARGW